MTSKKNYIRWMHALATKRKVMKTFQKHIFSINKLHCNIYPHLYLWNFTENLCYAHNFLVNY